MFLSQLTDMEKKAFISFCIHAANSNGVFAEEEKAMIHEYCKEMEIKYSEEDEIMPMEDVVAVFSKSDIHNKKITLFEIIGLVYSDEEYDAEEKKFVNEYAEKIGLTVEEAEKQKELIVRYLKLLKEIVQAVS